MEDLRVNPIGIVNPNGSVIILKSKQDTLAEPTLNIISTVNTENNENNEIIK